MWDMLSIYLSPALPPSLPPFPSPFLLLCVLNVSQEHKVRENFVAALQTELSDMGLKFSIGMSEKEAAAYG